MPQNSWFRTLPTTGRSAAMLARRHGYTSVAALARSLPPDAAVLDVGAGASALGKEVARLRPDVRWTNLDFSYHDSRILGEARRDAPPNLVFVAGDATKLDASVKPASMDAVFSYWLLPHLSLYAPDPALAAARQIYAAAKPGGMVAVGPRRQPLLHPAALMGRSWRITKNAGLTAAGFSREVLRQTQLSAINRRLRSAFNAAAFDLFSTSRYIKGGRITRWQVYNPGTGAYLPLYSPGAVHLAGKLLAGVMVRLIARAGPEDNDPKTESAEKYADNRE